jgi:hypothetical protein
MKMVIVSIPIACLATLVTAELVTQPDSVSVVRLTVDASKIHLVYWPTAAFLPWHIGVWSLL